jgi:RimJ/RimL family protein N-acetyltransferase
LRPFWGQGLASAAAQRLLAHHFFSSDAPIVLGHFVGNGPSARVLARLGFHYTHVESVVPLSTGVKTRLERMVLDRAAWWAVHGLPIVTPRLLLRPMSASDASDFHALVTRPEVARMLFMFSADWPFAKAVPFLEDWRWQGRGRFRLAIIQNGDWAGWIGTDDAAEPEVFYALRPEFAGQGVAQEALRGFCQFLFATFSPLALRAGVFTDNPASANVLRRCGFAQVAEVMGHSAGRAAPAPEWRFRLEQTDLPA